MDIQRSDILGRWRWLGFGSGLRHCAALSPFQAHYCAVVPQTDRRR